MGNRPFYSCVFGTWPWIGSEAGGDLVLIQTSLLQAYVDHVVLMLTSLHLHMKKVRSVSKQGHPQPRFQSKARSLNTQL